ncbi:hypothetical protein [Halorubellus litoreus]|uniref:Small CPxCG-related zinc finger protein n=1 Tax=Halorubellus litoreus TaxID=755308 RepID=A0ABD5VR69_9EURY
MADPTEAHDFTFGCYRGVDVTLEDADASTTTSVDEPTPVTDGGPAGATACPACESDLANVQGVPACTHCAWNAR